MVVLIAVHEECLDFLHVLNEGLTRFSRLRELKFQARYRTRFISSKARTTELFRMKALI